MSGRPASRVEVACVFAALAGLGAGILGLAADVWPLDDRFQGFSVV